MRNLYLCQVNWSNCAGNTLGHWLPYSVGSLWAYARCSPSIAAGFRLKEILFRRDKLAAVMERIQEPGVFGFSTYLWTEQYNLALARQVKARWPDCLIVFGGPQIPDDGIDYLREHPFIDVLVHSEGEESFARLLEEALAARPDYRGLPGCTVRQGDELAASAPAPRIRDLEKLSSPYLEGVFDDILRDNPGVEWNAVIETNRGCPYQCAFCDWGTLTYSKVVTTEKSRALGEIEWLARNGITYVLPADANFGIFADRDRELIEHFVRCKQRYGYPSAVGMSFAKNSNLRIVDMAATLHEAKLLKGMTLSAQSMTPEVLAAINRRNLASSDFSFLLHECERRGIPTYTELILGLPLETYESWKRGLCEALECGQHNQLESWLLELLRNAPLASAEAVRDHGIRAVRMKNYCFVFDAQSRDEIPEEADIVIETSTMSRDDMEAALGFSMIIYNLHAYGWTQAISRVLNKKAGVPYLDFYSELEQWIRARPETVLGHEYLSTRAAFHQMVETGDYIVDRHLLGINVGAVPIGLRSQGFLHVAADRVLEEIRAFTLSCYERELGEFAEDVLRFQKHFVTLPGRGYPYRRTFDHDVLGLAQAGEGAGKRTEYEFNLTYSFSSLDDYILKIYSRKKQGFGKALIRRVSESPLSSGLSSPQELLAQ